MIIDSLLDYYERRAADPISGIAPQGWEWKPLPFIVEIGTDGSFVQIVDTRQPDGRRLVAQRFLVPVAIKRTVAVTANLLWDSSEYALAVVRQTGASSDRVAKQHAAFVERIRRELDGQPVDLAVQALLRFLRDVPLEATQASPSWPELAATNPFISFRVAGDSSLICRRPDVIRRIDAAGQGGAPGRCLVTGREGPIARLHPSTKGIRGAQTSGASLVSFNLKAFESYGKSQGDNAPIGSDVAFAYGTALNDLLSQRQVPLADTTLVYWAERADASEIVAAFTAVISEPPRDDPDAGSKAVTSVLESIRTGASLTGDDDSRFTVIGLSPNAARLSIRSAHVLTVRSIAHRIDEHVRDLEIALPPFLPRHPPLFRLLNSIAVQGKADNVPPNLASDVVRAVITGVPYPMSLLQCAVRRARVSAAQQFDPMPLLAALIKASLNRRRRLQRNTSRKELQMSLDSDNPSVGYRLGRLFAVLERAQELASGGTLNATIRDTSYGAASSTPVTVFPRLVRLKNHHVRKFERAGDRTWIERQIGEIMEGISGFPAHLDLTEQGLFAVGYYHQRQARFTKSPTQQETNTEEENAG